MTEPVEHPLAGFFLKFQRAETHFRTLHDEINGFLNGDFYAAGVQLDRNRHPVVRIKLTRPIPGEWSVLIGEIVYDLRSALDHLAYQLAIAESGDPLPDDIERSCAFPIFDNGPKFRRRTKKGSPDRRSGLFKIQGINRRAQATIERLQPYHGRKNPASYGLLILEELSNVDKHRLLHVTTAALERSRYRITSPAIQRITKIRAYDRAFKHDTTTVARFFAEWVPGIPPEVQMDLDLVAEIRFDKRSPANSVRGLPVLMSLEVALNYVWRHVLAELGPFLGYEYVPSGTEQPSD